MSNHIKQERITQKQVAQDAGVSQSTVALALQGNPSIPPATRERVLNSMRKLGYVYNRGAANLRKGDSSLTGVLLSNLVNPFAKEVLVGIQKELSESGTMVLFGSTFESLATQDRLVSSMLEHGVGGIILHMVPGTPSETILRIERLGASVVLLSRLHTEIARDFVTPDSLKGAQILVEHLIRLGHSRIALLGGYSPMTAWRARKNGYERALRRRGLKVDPTLIIEGSYSRESAPELVRKALELRHPPTALFFFNDDLALGGMIALKKNGLFPGHDLAVVGFDGIPEGELFNPTLTTVDCFSQLLGIHAVRLLMKRMKNPDLKRQTIILPPKLVIRESCGASSGKR